MPIPIESKREAVLNARRYPEVGFDDIPVCFVFM